MGDSCMEKMSSFAWPLLTKAADRSSALPSDTSSSLPPKLTSGAGVLTGSTDAARVSSTFVLTGWTGPEATAGGWITAADDPGRAIAPLAAGCELFALAFWARKASNCSRSVEFHRSKTLSRTFDPARTKIHRTFRRPASARSFLDCGRLIAASALDNQDSVCAHRVTWGCVEVPSIA